MNGVEHKIEQVMTQPKKTLVMSKKIGGYNSPVKSVGCYNSICKKKLGHYNC